MNVLSIDFDIIMAPDINLYNPLVSPSPEGDRTIDSLIERYPHLMGCRADLKHYQVLLNYIINNIETIDVERIRVANNHEDIKHILDLCEDVHVFSVDHHHDLGYPIPSDVPEEEANMCTCANWGKVFLDNGTITKFTWINNMNSENPQVIDIAKDNRIEVKDLGNVILDELPPMDYIFLCLSPEWVPSQYHPLFYGLLDIINKLKRCRLEMH